MKKIKIILQGYECLRCKHQWIPNLEHPRTCPVCRSAYWDIPKKKKRVNKKDEINK